MQDLYYKTAYEIGYKNPPPLILTKLKEGNLAYAKRVYTGGGMSERTLGYQILIDAEQISSESAPMHPKYTIAHELAHVVCWGVVGGGGTTADGEPHGVAFLACWLNMLERMGVKDDEFNDLAWWHGQRYGLSKEQVIKAVKAAYAHKSPHIAASEAAEIPSTPRWHNITLLAILMAFISYIPLSIYLK